MYDIICIYYVRRHGGFSVSVLSPRPVRQTVRDAQHGRQGKRFRNTWREQISVQAQSETGTCAAHLHVVRIMRCF